MSKFSEQVGQFENNFVTLRSELTNLIIDELSIVGNIDCTEDEDYQSFAIAYDGGNHPERDSTIVATVCGISLENGDLVVETEFGFMYDIYYVDDLLTIATIIETYKDKNNL